MFDFNTATIIVVMLFALVWLGVHVAIALGMTSVVGIYLVTGKWRIVEATLASTAAEAMRDFTFAVIPLFMLMGEFIGFYNVKRLELLWGINAYCSKIPCFAQNNHQFCIPFIICSIDIRYRKNAEKQRKEH